MSYRRFDQDDIVVSADSITSPAWSNSSVQLTSFHTSSQVSADSGKYYYSIYNNGDAATQEIQFSVAYGNKLGSGSALYDAGVLGKSYSSTVYGQFRTLINGDEDTNFTFDNNGTLETPDSIYALSIQRARYKEKLLPGSLFLKLKGNVTGKIATLHLTDNSKNLISDTFTDAGRVYSLYSASAAGEVHSTSVEYGKMYPDVGTIILNAEMLSSSNYLDVGAGALASFTGSNYSTHNHNLNLVNSLNSGSQFVLRSDETLTSNFIFVRARNSEFNYSTNPSNITGSGELRHSVMIDNPQSYLTQVGLYNDSNDLLAVAKLSTPLLKDFTKETLIRIKLDY
jgi:hypothetical protein